MKDIAVCCTYVMIDIYEATVGVYAIFVAIFSSLPSYLPILRSIYTIATTTRTSMMMTSISVAVISFFIFSTSSSSKLMVKKSIN